MSMPSLAAAGLPPAAAAAADAAPPAEVVPLPRLAEVAEELPMATLPAGAQHQQYQQHQPPQGIRDAVDLEAQLPQVSV